MTKTQKIALRLSEVRQRLNAIAGIEGDDFTDEIRNEADALGTEYGDLETRHRAAMIAEGTDEARARAAFGDPDGRGRRTRGGCFARPPWPITSGRHRPATASRAALPS